MNLEQVSTIKKSAGLADPTPSGETMLKAAIAYAERLKFPVIPLHFIIDGKCTCRNPNCDNEGKHPRIKDWQINAALDRKSIMKWFNHWPASNIGLPTGSTSGFFVLDVDVDKGGLESLEELQEKNGPLPDTVQQITGSGGSHYLFKYQDGVGNKVDFLPGLDIRGEGGFIVAAPSIHISGNRYEWELSSHPLEMDVAEAPHWLIDMIITPKGGAPKRPPSHWNRIMQGFNEHEGRNSAATSLAGHLFRKYVDPDLVVEIMNLWNERNNPPLDMKELHTTINSIAGKELQRRADRQKGGFRKWKM